MNDFNFVLFTGHKGKNTVAISISKPGILSFTSGTIKKFNIANYNGAQLLFDKSKNTIAIKLYQEQTKDMFKFKLRKDNKGAFIACKSFLSEYELDNEKYFGKKEMPEEIEHPELGKLIILKLDDLS